MQSSAPGRSPRPARARRAPAAFTLLELLIAIAIIGILASLILTVAGSANTKAKITQVSVDIQDLSKGIAAFKQRFGVEPPSHITIYEVGTGSAPAGTGWASDPRSMGIIRQIWPQFDFSYAAEGGSIDINGDALFTGDGVTGTSSGAIALSGAECLVFFLGGIPATLHQDPTNVHSPLVFGGAPSGFSTNPADPFAVTVAANPSAPPPNARTVVGTNRERFTEFDFSRLFLYHPLTGAVHTMNTYKDTIPNQQQPYLYFSSYGGQGYDTTHELPAGPSSVSLTGSPTFADVYRQGPAGATSASPSPPWNPNSYQIISPGFDGSSDPYGGYGTGGQYDPNTAGTMLVGPAPGGRGPERDNITNFSSGPLAP
ncbi:MAG TPA: prepilin-type N-terminal cleavage/methylation domain-containing protein [Planctomycetaceae bacterium]|jgi:prepilin-type N-terminal cleavage/methylation domain-containing protein|nr:prepilin-type N-terminal cleavage/methylation domain-containing protein [Planctomycetaceae bacterium]